MGTEFTPTHGIAHPDGQHDVDIEVILDQTAATTDAALTDVKNAAAEYTNQEGQNLRVAIYNIIAEPGTLVENSVIDPKPLDALANYGATGSVTLAQAPGWGRATTNTTGTSSVVWAYLHPTGTDTDRRQVAVSPGDKITARVELRAMPTQRMSATMQVFGWTAGGTSSLLLATDQLHMDPNQAQVFEVTGTVPATGVDFVELRWTYRRYGETYPSVGDFIYFRRALLSVGPNVDASTPVTYFDGDTAGAYWTGAADGSPSMIFTPRSGGGGGESSVIEPGAGRREAVVSGGLTRRGGVIGTGGRPAIALRFDHHTTPFLSKVLPLLKEHGLPWGQMLNANRLGTTGTEAGTAAQMQTACIETGGEAWNHSYSHSDVNTTAEADREITLGLSALRAAMPRLWIDGWAGPGQTNYMGLEGSDTIEKWWDTETGRRVLAQHAFIRGYYQGVHTHLAGPNLIGGPHVTIDSQTRAWALSAVSAVANTRRGLTMMLHPNYLDTAGYMTTADLTAILTDIAARRDRGELEVLTPTGILMADSTRPRGSHLDGVIEAGTVPAGGITATPSSRTWLPTVGVPHEAGVTLSGSGTATLTVTLTTGSGTVTATRDLTLTADPRRLVVPVTPPLNTTAVTVALTAPTGTAHLGLTYRPI